MFIFNMGGHLVVSQYLLYRSDNFMNEQISKNLYKTSDLVEIKIPVQFPSIYNWEDYQSISGQVQLSGNCYNYVKLKITPDTMFLMCIPNYEKTNLINSNIIYAKQVSDSPLNKKSHEALPKTTITIVKYNCLIEKYSFSAPCLLIEKINSDISYVLDDPCIAINGQPPEATS